MCVELGPHLPFISLLFDLIIILKWAQSCSGLLDELFDLVGSWSKLILDTRLHSARVINCVKQTAISINFLVSESESRNSWDQTNIAAIAFQLVLKVSTWVYRHWRLMSKVWLVLNLLEAVKRAGSGRYVLAFILTIICYWYAGYTYKGFWLTFVLFWFEEFITIN